MEVESKQCLICQQLFPRTTEYFYKTKTSKDGLQPYCKECAKKKSSKWGKENKEKQRKYSNKSHHKNNYKELLRISTKKRRENGEYKKWQDNNKDKISKYHKDRMENKKHKISKKEWKSCKEYFNNCCAYCGLPIEEHTIKYKGEYRQGDFHREHVDHEGSNDLSNCVPSCKTCNSSKSNKDFDNWYNENNPIYDRERCEKIQKWLKEDYKQCNIIKNELQYKIIKKIINKNVKFELWLIDTDGTLLKYLMSAKKKEDLDKYINFKLTHKNERSDCSS